MNSLCQDIFCSTLNIIFYNKYLFNKTKISLGFARYEFTIIGNGYTSHLLRNVHID